MHVARPSFQRNVIMENFPTDPHGRFLKKIISKGRNRDSLIFWECAIMNLVIAIWKVKVNTRSLVSFIYF